MTKRRLLYNVSGVIALLLSVVGAALCWPPLYAVLKDFSSLVLLIAAAYLGYCFQKRQAFLSGLRDLWNECVEAKADLIDYTHNPHPTEEDFQKAARSISVAIDMVRAVYRNIGENKKFVGLYPFEPLHDMRKALDDLGFHEVTKKNQKVARDNIVNSWNALRWCFLSEFYAPIPSRYITFANETDPRRRGDSMSIGRPIRTFHVPEPKDKGIGKKEVS